MSENPRQRFTWGFGSGALAVLALGAWVELCASLVRFTIHATGGDKMKGAVGFFFAVLPMLAIAVYRWPLVFDFFRSVKVGVINLVFIGLGAIVGVLWHQEDPNFPLNRTGMDELVRWEELDRWTPDTAEAYLQYVGAPSGPSGFRNAHAYFIYKLLHGRGFHALPGVAAECRVDHAAIATQMDNLDRRLPQVQARFGEEFAVGLRASSASGLHNRAENAEIGQFEADWDDFFWTLFVWSHRLDLIRVYKADWYAALWAILFLGVLSNTFRGGWRRLLRPAKWGFVITHAGVLLIVAGAFQGRVLEERGAVDLHVGDLEMNFQPYRGGRAPFHERNFYGGRGQPFGLRLDAFRADYFDVLDVGYVKSEADGSARFEFPLEQPKVRVYQGQRLAYDYGRDPESGRTVPWLRLEVLEYYPKAEIEHRLREARDEFGLPLAHLRLRAADGSGSDRILLPKFDLPLIHGGSGVRVRFDVALDRTEALELLQRPLEERLGQLLVVRPDGTADGEPMAVAVGAARSIEIDGRSYEIEVVTAVPQLQLEARPDGGFRQVAGNRPPELEAPDNPAVLVRIRDQSGTVEERWVLEREFRASEPKFTDLDFLFQWDRWAAPAAARWSVFMLRDASLLCGRHGAPETLQPIAVGASRSLGAVDLVVDGAFLNGEEELIPRPVSGADFFQEGLPAVRVRVTTPNESKELVLDGRELLTHDVDDWQPALRYTGPDGQPRDLWLRLREDLSDLPVEWRSKLSIVTEAGAHSFEPVAGGEIRVNDYLTYRGYRFFQNSARPNDPTYSGIGVVYDPGIEPVLLGLYLVAGGTILVFVVRPLLTRKRRED